MTHKYEKVEGLKVWEILKLHEEGVALYTGKFDNLRIESITNLDALVMAMENGSLYRKIESPWWEKHVGSVVMVKDDGEKNWTAAIFKEKHESQYYDSNGFDGFPWDQMRPLTAAEKDAIITEG